MKVWISQLLFVDIQPFRNMGLKDGCGGRRWKADVSVCVQKC